MPVISGGVGGIQSVTVSLTDAQVKALPTTPIQVIAAQGAGKLVLAADSGAFPAIVSLGGANAAYSNVNAGATLVFANPGVNNDGAGGWSAGYAAHGLLVYGVPTIGPVILPCTPSQISAGGVSANEQSVNARVTISINNQGSGDLTGGDAANTFTVTLLYAVVPAFP